MPLLSVEGVSKRFDGVTAVDQVSFAVDRGQVVGFLGPNGAGKSTTMRMITQYYEPDTGDIKLDGVPLADVARQAKRRIGYLPENNPLYGDMLVSDYLGFIADLRELAGAGRRQALDEAVTGTGIESVYYRPIGELSKGYRQRVGLAQAILHRPDLLVLDEPTEGLDPNQRLEIRRLIGALGKDRTVILSTHVLPEVQHTCSRLLIISRGKIVADGPVGRLIQQAEGAVEIAVEAAGTGVAEALGQLAGVRQVSPAGPATNGRVALTLTADRSTDLRPEIFGLAKARGWTLYELHQAAGSLEELFHQLTRQRERGREPDPTQRATRAEGVVRPADRLHPARRVHRGERAAVLPRGGGLQHRLLAADARLPSLAAAVPGAGRDDAGPGGGPALGHPRGRAGAADHGARAAARQVLRSAAVPAHRPGDHPHGPARPRARDRAGARHHRGPVRGSGPARRGTGGRGRVGVERESEPDHGVHRRRLRDVPADLRGTGPAAGGIAAPPGRHRRRAGRAVAFQPDRPRGDRPARRRLLRDARGAVPRARVLRAALAQAHRARRSAQAPPPGDGAARARRHRREPARRKHRRPDRPDARPGLHARSS